MNWFPVFAAVAALLHVLFFVLETVIWGSPTANKIFRVQAEAASAPMTTLFAKNQGFYNLFLAGGVAFGIYFNEPAVVLWSCISMLGAAIVLVGTSPKLVRGALIQGVPPALALAAWFFA